MKSSIAMVQTTYATISTMRQNLLKESPSFLQYAHYVITTELIKDIDKETVMMMDSFEAMHETFNIVIEAYSKILKHPPHI